MPLTCSFCEDDLDGKALLTTDHVYVLKNRVSYDLWEMREVTDHLLVVPRQHVTGLAELSDEAKLDIIDIISDYESQGYNIYARGIGSGQRSVDHQHTHLIKTKLRRVHGSLSIRRPYVLVKF